MTARGPATPEITVDRLRLSTGPMSAAEARHLAALVCVALARRPLPPGARSASTLRVDVAPQSGRSLEDVADAVATAVADSLRREAVS
jgi:hypothetical protein